MRLIDADGLKTKNFVIFHEDYGRTVSDTVVRLSDIDDAPTIDVRENVHGEWIPGKELSREMCAGQVLHIEYENYRCSACGFTVDRLLYHIDGSPFYKFCPNCGADMRKEEMSE